MAKFRGVEAANPLLMEASAEQKYPLQVLHALTLIGTRKVDFESTFLDFYGISGFLWDIKEMRDLVDPMGSVIFSHFPSTAPWSVPC